MINHDIKHNTKINCMQYHSIASVVHIANTARYDVCQRHILAKARNHIACLKKEVIKFTIQYKNILAPKALT